MSIVTDYAFSILSKKLFKEVDDYVLNILKYRTENGILIYEYSQKYKDQNYNVDMVKVKNWNFTIS